MIWVNSPLFDELGQDHDALAFHTTFDVGGIVGDEGDAVHGRAALGGKARTFDVEVLDQHHGIARAQRDTVAVAVVALLGGVVGPGLGLVVEIELIGQIAGPVGVEAFERAQGVDLKRGIVAPLGRGDGAEVVGRGLRVSTRGAQRDGGTVRAACHGGVDERCIGGAEGQVISGVQC